MDLETTFQTILLITLYDIIIVMLFIILTLCIHILKLKNGGLKKGCL